jgi:hypothetical protein
MPVTGFAGMYIIMNIPGLVTIQFHPSFKGEKQKRASDPLSDQIV